MNIITASGQRWKVILGSLLALPAVYLAVFERSAADEKLLLGLASTFGAFAFTCASVRCPVCRARWVWMAVNEQKHNRFVLWLMQLQNCPKCGFAGAHLNESRRAT
jgi:hypothetical protein